MVSDVQALVQRAQANDRAAFGELYELYCPKIYSYLAYHLNGRSEAAEDLTEEVFMKALQNLGSFQFREVPFSSWLYRIAHNHLIDHIRSSKKVSDAFERACARHEITPGKPPPDRMSPLSSARLEIATGYPRDQKNFMLTDRSRFR